MVSKSLTTRMATHAHAACHAEPNRGSEVLVGVASRATAVPMVGPRSYKAARKKGETNCTYVGAKKFRGGGWDCVPRSVNGVSFPRFPVVVGQIFVNGIAVD